MSELVHIYGVKVVAAHPHHSTFIGACQLWLKLNYSNQQRIVPPVSQTSVMENGREWKMAILLEINYLRRRQDERLNYNNQRTCPYLTEEKYSGYYKSQKLKPDEPKALVSVDSMVNWSDHAQKTRLRVERKYVDMAGFMQIMVVLILLMLLAEICYEGAQKKKKEWEVKFEATLARFEKWKESSKNLEKLRNSSMSTRTKIGLGFKEYFGKDEAGEMQYSSLITGTFIPTPYKSTKKHIDKSSDSETYASCDSSLKTKTKDFPPAVDIKTLPESDVEDPNSTAGSPSFSCSENVKSPRIICNKSGMNNRNVCKNNSVRVKKCFVCGSKLHLIKDCDFYNCVDSVPCKSKAASVPAGSRNSSASVTADGSDPAASRNRPAVNSAGRPKPTERVGQPAGWSKRPAPVSAGRPVSAGWLNPAARPYFRPSSVHFNNMYWPNVYDPMYMNKGQWGTAGDPSTDNDIVVPAVKDPAGVDSAVKDPTGVDSAVKNSAGVDSADGVSTSSPSADSDPAGGNPGDCFPPAGSVEPAVDSNPAVSSSVSADLNSVYADE
ncbi:hypothetical protein Tco_0841892, partial [Tanacetum coccineum]